MTPTFYHLLLKSLPAVFGRRFLGDIGRKKVNPSTFPSSALFFHPFFVSSSFLPPTARFLLPETSFSQVSFCSLWRYLIKVIRFKSFFFPTSTNFSILRVEQDNSFWPSLKMLFGMLVEVKVPQQYGP